MNTSEQPDPHGHELRTTRYGEGKVLGAMIATVVSGQPNVVSIERRTIFSEAEVVCDLCGINISTAEGRERYDAPCAGRDAP